METGLVSSNLTQFVVPGKKLLIGGLASGELAIVFPKPKRQTKLSLEFGRIERFRIAGRAFLAGQEVGRGKFVGTYQLLGFEPLETATGSYPMTAPRLRRCLSDHRGERLAGCHRGAGASDFLVRRGSRLGRGRRDGRGLRQWCLGGHSWPPRRLADWGRLARLPDLPVNADAPLARKRRAACALRSRASGVQPDRNVEPQDRRPWRPREERLGGGRAHFRAAPGLRARLGPVRGCDGAGAGLAAPRSGRALATVRLRAGARLALDHQEARQPEEAQAGAQERG